MSGWKGDPNAFHQVVDGEIAGLTEKASPVAADLVLINDSEDSNSVKSAQAGNLPGGSGGGNAAHAETIGDGSATEYQVTHSLGTQDLIVQLWDVSGAEPLEATGDVDHIEIDDDDNLTVTFGSAPATDAYRVVIVADGGSSGSTTRIGEATLTTPPSTGWSWVNQGSATETVESEGSIVVVTPAVGSNNLLGRVRSYTAPDTATARLNARPAGQTHSGVGVWFRESSTGKISAVYIKPNGDIVIENWTNATTFSASVTSISPGTGNLPLWLEIEDDNTDLFYRVGRDGFEGNFYEITSVGRTSFMAGGPDEYGWMLRDNNAAKAGTLSSWATS